MFRFLTFTAFILCLTSCGNSGTSSNSNDHSKDKKSGNTANSGKLSVNDFALVEPVKKCIYYMDEIDVTTYDSISTLYFHEVLDYKDSTAIALETEIIELEEVVNSESRTVLDKQIASDEISVLSEKLNKYKKEVTGYVFVHTFMNKGDTVSAIIVTNASMTNGEAYPINKISAIEPSEYTDKVRKIE